MESGPKKCLWQGHQQGHKTLHKISNTDLSSIAVIAVVLLTLKLPGEGQMALPLTLNDKNIPNADFFLVF